MNLKEKYIKGNNFIFSPRGKISRTRYILYAFILDVLYRLLLAFGTVLGKDISPILFVLGFLAIPILIFKMFNYKKRIYSFLNNDFLSYAYSILYLIIGGLIIEYTHLLKLSTQKALFELTNDVAFQKYSNINIPDFIGSDLGQYIFYTLIFIGIVMYLLMILMPQKDHNITNKTKEISTINKKTAFVLIALIFSISISIFSYKLIKDYAYKSISYKMNQTEIGILNAELEKRYNKNFQEYQNSLDKYNSMSTRTKILFSYTKPEEPIPPQFYGIDYTAILDNPNEIEFDNLVIRGIIQVRQRYDVYLNQFDTKVNKVSTLVNSEFDIFKCYQSNYGIFKNTCGNLNLTNDNTEYLKENYIDKFNPQKICIFAYTFSIFIGALLSFLLFKLFYYLKKIIKKVNLKKIFNFILSIFVVFKSKIKFPLKNNREITLTEKLEELVKLKEQGLITEEDYNKKKDELLKDFH